MVTSAEPKSQRKHPAATRPAEGFSLAERYALLSDAELEEMAARKARAEVTSSAYEGVPLDEPKLRAELLALYREIRAEQGQSAR